MSASHYDQTSSAPASSALASSVLDGGLSASSQRAAMYERQIKELEDHLSEDLSNCRAIEGLLRDSFSGIKRNYRRSEKDALLTHIPHINSHLDESLTVLTDLEHRLPEIRSKVAQVRLVYDSGRQKAKELVHDLEWLNTDFYERWRIVIFTSHSPVSWRWKSLMRVLFAVFFAFAAWVTWIALRGAYRAHRVRLVWGDGLMS